MQKLLVAAAMCVASLGASAQSQIEGLTFSTWTDSGYYRGPGLPLDGYVVVQDSADVGRYFSSGQYTSIRSEFNLAGQQAAGSAVLSFEYDARYAVLSYPASQSMTVFLGSYAGDNVAHVSDWSTVTVGSPGSGFLFSLMGPPRFGQFETAGLTFGQTLSYDVTSLYNLSLARGDAALGIGLDSGINFQYAKFGNFTLTVTPPVPEPSTYALLLGGLALVGFARRHRARSVGGN